MMETLPLDDRHMHDLLDMAKAFVDESGWNWTFSEESTQEKFERHIDSPLADVIGVFDNGRLVGAAMVVAAQDFVAEEACFVAKFYILPAGRGTNAGRVLAQAIVEWADHMNCACIFATATAAVGGDRAFENLLRKAGFEAAGATMYRIME